MRTGVPQPGIEYVEEVQRVVKYYSLSSYMLKPPFLLTQGFNKNKKSQGKLFSHMCNFGAREEWRNGKRSVCSYLDVEISNNQDRLVNPNPLDCIVGYILEHAICDSSLKRMPHQRLNLIYGFIESYLSILNFTERLFMIKQAN